MVRATRLESWIRAALARRVRKALPSNECDGRTNINIFYAAVDIPGSGKRSNWGGCGSAANHRFGIPPYGGIGLVRIFDSCSEAGTMPTNL